MSNPWDDDPIAPWANDPPAASPSTLNKYQQEAVDQSAKSKAAGLDTSYGLPARYLNGAMFQGLPTVMAGLETPIEMARHGTLSPSEGYSYAKAKEDLSLGQSKQSLGMAGTAADIAGGVVTGSGLARGGLTLARPGAGLLRTAAGTAGDGAGYGLLSGFLGGGDSLSDRTDSALKGGLIGGLTGGALPILASGVSLAASPITSNIRARINPAGFATSQAARAVSEGGQSIDQLQQALDNATAAGQGNFTLADALGNPGQRMLSTVARSPGAGRTAAVDFLENRQAGQGRGLSAQLADALGAPDTAAQRTATLTTQRSSDAAANYDAARNSAGAVDATPAINIADQFLSPGSSGVMNPGSTIADDSIEAAVRRARSYLTGQNGEQVSDFPTALRSKQELDNLIDRGSASQQRMLIPMRNALDDQLAAASPDYANARNTFRQQSQAIDAIDTGRSAAMRGRPEDTIPAYNAMRPDQQSAYRAGYADPTIEGITNAAPGVNKARPLLNDGTSSELAAMSLHNGPYQPGAPDALAQRIGRSNTMFETRAQALGGSRTFDNSADDAALKLDPSVVMHAVTGNIGGVVNGAIRAAGNTLTGSTPQVREQLARLLLMHGQNTNVAGALSGAVNNQARLQALVRTLTSGGLGALGNVIAGSSSPQRR